METPIEAPKVNPVISIGHLLSALIENVMDGSSSSKRNGIAPSGVKMLHHVMGACVECVNIDTTERDAFIDKVVEMILMAEEAQQR